jgi:hypothetical protein
MDVVVSGWEIFDRVVNAVERVRERLRRAVEALERGNVPYAVIGGNAVATWVSRIDPGAARHTDDVDVLIPRLNLPDAIRAMEASGFTYRHSAGIDMFLDEPKARARDAVHVIFAGEKVRSDYPFPAPDVQEYAVGPEGYRHLSLEALVRMKLTSNRRKDQVHIQDMINVGLIDSNWPAKFPSPLDERLQTLLDDPDG